MNNDVVISGFDKKVFLSSAKNALTNSRAQFADEQPYIYIGILQESLKSAISLIESGKPVTELVKV